MLRGQTTHRVEVAEVEGLEPAKEEAAVGHGRAKSWGALGASALAQALGPRPHGGRVAGTVYVVHAACPPAAAVEGERARWAAAFREWAASAGEADALWIVAPSGHEGGRLVPWPYLLADEASAAGWVWKNAYPRYAPAAAPPGRPFAAVHESILFFVRSLRHYAFDKAPLREPHVYKDIEWGRRTRGRTGYHDASRTSARYPEGGRDPGNVLVRERRSPGGIVEEVLEMPREDALARLIAASSGPEWTVRTNVDASCAARLRALPRAVEALP